MNRYILLFMLVGLQANVESKNVKWPEETKAVINEVEKKLNHCLENNLDEEQKANLAKFKNVCNDHLIKFMNKLPYIDNETIQRIPDEAIWICTNAIAEARQIPSEEMFIGGLAYLIKGSIENDIFKKIAEQCKKERKRLFKYNLKYENNYSIKQFRENFDYVTSIDKLNNSDKNGAIAVKNECSKDLKKFLRGLPYYNPEKSNKAQMKGIECVAIYAEIQTQELDGKTGAENAHQEVYNNFKQKIPGSIAKYFYRSMKKEWLDKTRERLH